LQSKSIEIRWRDLDPYGHVNNAVYLTYLEEVQDEWLAATLAEHGNPADFVIARVEIDFRRELRLADDEVLGRCRLVRVGRSSVTTRVELGTRDGARAAEAELVLVARDPETGASRALTPGERGALEHEPSASEPGRA